MNSAESQTQKLTPLQKAINAHAFGLNPSFMYPDDPEYGLILESWWTHVCKEDPRAQLQGIPVANAVLGKGIPVTAEPLKAAATAISDGGSGYLPNFLKEPVYIMPPERGTDAVDWSALCGVWAMAAAILVAVAAYHNFTEATRWAWLNLSIALGFQFFHHFRSRDLRHVDSLHREILKLHERISAFQTVPTPHGSAYATSPKSRASEPR